MKLKTIEIDTKRENFRKERAKLTVKIEVLCEKVRYLRKERNALDMERQGMLDNLL